MSGSIICGCGGSYKKYTQNRHNKSQKHTKWENKHNRLTMSPKERSEAHLCTLRALTELRRIRAILNAAPPPPPPPVNETASWKTIHNSYANLQKVYSTKMDGKSIHAFPYHDLVDTKEFVGNLKKCAGFSVNHRTNTFYVHSTIDTIYDNTNKEKNASKKQNWHTLYIKHY